MINKLIEFFKDKKIVILGFGREGKSTYKFIRKYLPKQEVFIADSSLNISSDELVKDDKYASFVLGDKYLDKLETYDIIMKSPGIAFNKIDTAKFESKIFSELELLLKFYEGKTIGITGTKGKSTTSTLIYQVLKDQGLKVLFGGNIGIAVFDLLEDLVDVDYLVLEMGCHQLQYMDVSPNYSIFLNVYEEHLDHYHSYDEYIEAKCNIFKYQNEGDYYFYNNDLDIIKNKNNKYNTKAKRIGISFNDVSDVYIKDNYIYFADSRLYDITSERMLLGRHNLNNIMFILALSRVLNLDFSKVLNTISNFKGLEHRMEYVGTYDSIKYYNDSISTIPEATINALMAIKTNTLILGGLDRGIDYSKLIDYMNSYDLDNLVCLKDTGYQIGRKITNKNIKIFFADSMEEAVSVCKKNTIMGGVVLLSPAAASYNTFKNFEERGNKFKDLVRNS